MTQFPTVRYPDAVEVVVAALVDGLDAIYNVSTPVRDKLPADHTPDDEAVTVRRDGGPSMWPVWDRPQIAVACYSPVPSAAADLVAKVRTVMAKLPGTVAINVPISRVEELAGPSYAPDPNNDQPCYRMAFVLTLRGYDPADD